MIRLGAGSHEVVFGTADLAPGIYVVRADVRPGSGSTHLFERRFTVVR